MGNGKALNVTKAKVLRPDLNGHSPDDRIVKCAEEIQQALVTYDCQMYTALRIGNAEAPLMEIGGLPIVVKVACRDPKA